MIVQMTGAPPLTTSLTYLTWVIALISLTKRLVASSKGAGLRSFSCWPMLDNLPTLLVGFIRV